MAVNQQLSVPFATKTFFVNMILNDDTQNFLVGLWVFDLSGSLEWLRGGFLSPVWKKMDDKKVAWKGLLCGFSAGPPPGLLLKKSTERARVASKIVFIFSIGHSTRLSIITGRAHLICRQSEFKPFSEFKVIHQHFLKASEASLTPQASHQPPKAASVRVFMIEEIWIFAPKAIFQFVSPKASIRKNA